MIRPRERRLSFTQMVRNAVLAARKDAAPQKAAPSGRVYRGMAWGFMQVDHPVRALFIRLVEWCAARVKPWHEQWLLPQSKAPARWHRPHPLRGLSAAVLPRAR